MGVSGGKAQPINKSRGQGPSSKPREREPKFREFQDRFQDDARYLARHGNMSQEDAASMNSRGRSKQAGKEKGPGGGRRAWDTGSRHSSLMNKSVNRVFNQNR
jgi:hypothetical protein